MMKKIPRFNKAAVLAAVLLPALVLAACQNTGYKVMSVNEGIQSFSFEYPDNYQLIRLSLENSPSAQYTEVGLSAVYGDNYSEIYVYIWPVGDDTSSAESIMDSLLESGDSKLRDFVLVEESTTMIGDTIARRATFTADSASAGNSTQSASRPAIYRLTTMIYAGVAVEVDMTCDIALADATAGDYQHVLDTLSIMG
jgi:predicted small secreted protein